MHLYPKTKKSEIHLNSYSLAARINFVTVEPLFYLVCVHAYFRNKPQYSIIIGLDTIYKHQQYGFLILIQCHVCLEVLTYGFKKSA